MIEHDYKLKQRNALKDQEARQQAISTVAMINDFVGFTEDDRIKAEAILFDAFYAFAEQARKETVELFINAVKGVEA